MAPHSQFRILVVPSAANHLLIEISSSLPREAAAFPKINREMMKSKHVLICGVLIIDYWQRREKDIHNWIEHCTERRSINVYLFMALQPFFGPWPLFQFLDLLHSRLDSLDGGSARRKAATCTQNKHRHPCLKWVSNPRSQCSRGRRQFMP
jgi:hypothetical protein